MKRFLSLSVGLGILFATSQALAFGAMGGGVGGASMGPNMTMMSLNVPMTGTGARRGGAGDPASVPGAVSLHGITVMPDGKLIVPAVTPRNELSPTSGPVCPNRSCVQH